MVFCAQLQAQNRSCRDVLAVAESFLMDGNVENTRKILNQTRATCGNDESWYYIRFGYDMVSNQTDSCIFFMKKAVELFPKNDSLYCLLAQSYLVTYDSLECTKALQAIDKAIGLKAKPFYQLVRVQVLHALGKNQLALEEIGQLKNSEKNYEALVEWGSLLKDIGKPKEAIQKLNKAIRLDKYSTSAYLQKADIYFNVYNQQDEALAALDTVEMIDSTLADPMLMRAAFFESHNDFDNAISEYDMAIQTDSSVHQVYMFRGTCLKEIKEFDLAEEDYKQYKKLNPDDNEINFMMADLYIAKGDFNGAALLMSQMESKGNSSYDMFIMRGIAYTNNGQYESALTDFNKAENFIDERDIRLYYNRGLCFLAKEEHRKAMYDFERAKNLDPQDMELFYLHCKAAHKAGYKDIACESCKIALFHKFEIAEKELLKDCK